MTITIKGTIDSKDIKVVIEAVDPAVAVQIRNMATKILCTYSENLTSMKVD